MCFSCVFSSSWFHFMSLKYRKHFGETENSWDTVGHYKRWLIVLIPLVKLLHANPLDGAFKCLWESSTSDVLDSAAEFSCNNNLNQRKQSLSGSHTNWSKTQISAFDNKTVEVCKNCRKWGKTWSPFHQILRWVLFYCLFHSIHF